MIEFKVEMDDYEMPEVKREYYPKLNVSDIKEPDGLPMGEWVEVVAKVKKCEMTVKETEDGKKYCCTYEVKGFSPMKTGGNEFAQELDKMMEG